MSGGPDDFDAVARGPEASVDEAAASGRAVAAGEAGHPSVEALRERFGEAVLRHEVQAGDEHVVHVDPDRIVEVLGWLKETPEHDFDLLRDVTAVDYGGGRPILVVYMLWSIAHRRALRIKCPLPLDDLEIDSVTGLWNTADWLEREVYDMFGVEFRDHPDLRRILMPENYAEGHPLRKDFPLRGRFSRAEQTRRALSQDPHDHYIPDELRIGGDPRMASGAPEGRPELPEGRGGPVPGEAPTEEPDGFQKRPHGRTEGRVADEDDEAARRRSMRGKGGGKASPGVRAPAEADEEGETGPGRGADGGGSAADEEET